MRTVVALYDRFEDAQQAIQGLHDAGFSREDMNLMARDASGQYASALDQANVTDVPPEPGEEGASTGAGVGAVLGGLGGLLAGLGALAIPGIGPVIAAGPIVTTLAGAGIGAVAGGIIGALVDLGIPEQHAQYYAEGIRRGGTLLTVRASDEMAERARDIMNRYHPVDIENRAASWRQERWAGFDQSAQPLPPEQMEFNRQSPDTSAGVDASRHINEDIYSRERVNDQNQVDIPVTGNQSFGEEVADVYVFPIDVEDYNRFVPDFRSHYQTSYGATGHPFEHYQTAYQYGYWLANNPQYAGYHWDRVEPLAQEEWRRRGLRGTWGDVRDAVHHAWEAVTHRL